MNGRKAGGWTGYMEAREAPAPMALVRSTTDHVVLIVVLVAFLSLFVGLVGAAIP